MQSPKFHVAKSKSFDLSPPSGDPEVICHVRESWRIYTSDGAACGGTWEYEVEKTIGVSKSELNNIQSKIASSLGIEIASISSEISSKMESIIKLEEVRKEKKKYIQPSGKCDVVKVEILQKVYDITFEIEEKGWFRTKKRRVHATEYSNEFAYECKKEVNHPDCGCPGSSNPIVGFVLAHVGTESCWLLLTLTQPDEGIFHLPELGVRLEHQLEPDRVYRAILPNSSLPLPVTFLADEKQLQVDVTFSLADENGVALWSDDELEAEVTQLNGRDGQGLATIDVTGLSESETSSIIDKIAADPEIQIIFGENYIQIGDYTIDIND